MNLGRCVSFGGVFAAIFLSSTLAFADMDCSKAQKNSYGTILGKFSPDSASKFFSASLRKAKIQGIEMMTVKINYNFYSNTEAPFTFYIGEHPTYQTEDKWKGSVRVKGKMTSVPFGDKIDLPNLEKKLKATGSYTAWTFEPAKEDAKNALKVIVEGKGKPEKIILEGKILGKPGKVEFPWPSSDTKQNCCGC